MGSVTVQQLMTELDASESTIRRDLNALAADGQLTKVHGGAILKNAAYGTTDDEVLHRRERNREAKMTIARYAAGLITAGDFVYIDAGTTTDLMIDYITDKNAVFVTNAVTHAKKLAGRGFHVSVLGGELKSATESLIGPDTIATLSRYHFTIGFWGVNGITPESGFTSPESNEALIKQLSMEHTARRYVLADASKFDSTSLVGFGPFSSATIITCGDVPERYRAFDNVVEVSL